MIEANKKISIYFRKTISSLLILGQFLQAFGVGQIAYAASPEPAHVTPDPSKSPLAHMETAPNGTSIVNISPVDSNQTSHTIFNDFNVPTNGLIINNSDTHGKSELAGQILGNPNLRDSGPASLIIHEVVGVNNSQLLGSIEIFGQKADYILANPNGITCRGCRFINMGKGTLTTGRVYPIEDSQNVLINVEQGSIKIKNDHQNMGLDAKGADYFDIVTRVAHINGQIHGKDVEVHTGRQLYNSKLRHGEQIGDDPNRDPALEVSLDSKHLGGIYADRIRLVGTEKGLGVNTPPHLASSTGEMILTADGDLVLRDMKAEKGDIQVTSTSGNIEIVQGAGVNSGRNISMEAAQEIVNKGSVRSEAHLEMNAAGNLTNHGNLAAPHMQLRSGQDMSNHGDIQSKGNIDFGTRQNFLNTGTILADRDIVGNSGLDLKNDGGIIQSANRIRLFGKDVKNMNSGSIFGKNLLEIDATNSILNQESLLASENKIALGHYDQNSKTGTTKVLNHSGRIYSRTGPIYLAGKLVDNQQLVRDVKTIGHTEFADLPAETASLRRTNNKRSSPQQGPRKNKAKRHFIEVYIPGSAQSEILSGGNISFNVGELKNYISKIIASEDITINGGEVFNSGLELKKGTQNRVMIEVNIGGSNGFFKKVFGKKKPTTMWIPTWKEENSTIIDTRSGLIQAGGKITGNLADKLFNETKDLKPHEAPDGRKLDPINAVKPHTALDNDINFGVTQTQKFKDNEERLAHNPFLLKDEHRGQDIKTYLTQSLTAFNAMYQQASDQNAKSLFESRIKYLDQSTFLSSDYFYKRVGFTPDATIKSIGDPSFEHDLVLQQIIDVTGRALLNGFPTSTIEQMRALVDNGAAFLNAHEIAPGIRLSGEFLKELSQDMVIYEEHVIDGQKVMVPKFYAANATRANLDLRGAMMLAKNIDLTVAGGSVTNSGLIEAQDKMTVTAGLDIENLSGKFKSGGDMNMNAERDIISHSKKKEVRSQNEQNYGVEKDQKASFESGGNMSMTAGNEVRLFGTEAKSGGKMTIHGAKGVVLGAEEGKSRFTAEGKGYEHEEQSVTHEVTSLESKDDMDISTDEGDVINQAGQLTSHQGKIYMEGDRVINEAVEDEHYTRDSTTKKGGLGAKHTRVTHTQSSTAQVSHINAAQGVKQHARHGDITLEGTQVDPGQGEAEFETPEGKVNLKIVSDSSAEDSTKTGKNLLIQGISMDHNHNKTYREVNFAKAPIIKARDGVEAETRKHDSILKPKIAHVPNVTIREFEDVHEREHTSQHGLTDAAKAIIAAAAAAATGGMGAAAAGGLGLEGLAASAFAGGFGAAAIGGTVTTLDGFADGKPMRGIKKSIQQTPKNFYHGAITGGAVSEAAGVEQGFVAMGVNGVIRAAEQAVVDRFVHHDHHMGSSFKKHLKLNGIEGLATIATHEIGDLFHNSEAAEKFAKENPELAHLTQSTPRINPILHYGMHAGVGALTAKALKEDAAIGAASAVIGEAVGELHQSATVDSTQSFEQRKQQGVFAAKMAAMVTAAVLTGGDEDITYAGDIAGRAAEHNAWSRMDLALFLVDYEEYLENLREGNVAGSIVSGGVTVVDGLFSIYAARIPNPNILLKTAKVERMAAKTIDPLLESANAGLGEYLQRSGEALGRGLTTVKNKFTGLFRSEVPTSVPNETHWPIVPLADDSVPVLLKKPAPTTAPIAKQAPVKGPAAKAPAPVPAPSSPAPKPTLKGEAATKPSSKGTNPNKATPEQYAQGIKNARAKGIDPGIKLKPGSKAQQKLQPWVIREGQEWKAKIFGSGQKTGTPGHSLQAMKEAIKAAKDEATKRVHLDHGLNRALKPEGVQGMKPNIRPDVTVIKNTGKVDLIEVPSKTDKAELLLEKLEKTMSKIPEKMRGEALTRDIKKTPGGTGK